MKGDDRFVEEYYALTLTRSRSKSKRPWENDKLSVSMEGLVVVRHLQSPHHLSSRLHATLVTTSC